MEQRISSTSRVREMIECRKGRLGNEEGHCVQRMPKRLLLRDSSEQITC